MWVLLYKPGYGIYNNSYISSPSIDLYETSQIFYTRIIHTYIYIYIYLKMNRSTKRFIFCERIIYFVLIYVYVSSLLFSSENTLGFTKFFPSMWHKAIWMGHPMGHEVPRGPITFWNIYFFHSLKEKNRYICVCVCVCVGSSRSFKHVSLNCKDTFCLYNLIKILLSLLIMCLDFRLELVGEFIEIGPCALGPFIGHHQELLA